LEIQLIQRSLFLSFDLTFDSVLYVKILASHNGHIIESLLIGLLDNRLNGLNLGEENNGQRNLVLSRDFNSLEILTSIALHHIRNKLNEILIRDLRIHSSDKDDILFFQRKWNWSHQSTDLAIPDVLIVQSFDGTISLVLGVINNLSNVLDGILVGNVVNF
jgi:hypothetical protein